MQNQLDALREDFEARRQVIHDLRNQMQGMETRMEQFRLKLEENTAITERIDTGTRELLEILNTAKGGLRVLGGLGAMLKWALGLAAALIAFWKAAGWKWPWQ